MLDDFRADLARYTAQISQPMSRLQVWRNLVETQGVWATAMYRFGRWTGERAPAPLRPACKAAYAVGFKLVEILAGISLPARARIGKGLYIGHFGGIIVHPDAVIGERCIIAQGVTIGVLGGPREGVPRIGDDVYLGAGAKILGGVTIGDGATVGANAVVLDDVPAGATAVGVPARMIVKRRERAA
jgi:serine O-acetyltransferase